MVIAYRLIAECGVWLLRHYKRGSHRRGQLWLLRAFQSTFHMHKVPMEHDATLVWKHSAASSTKKEMLD